MIMARVATVRVVGILNGDGNETARPWVVATARRLITSVVLHAAVAFRVETERFTAAVAAAQRSALCDAGGFAQIHWAVLQPTIITIAGKRIHVVVLQHVHGFIKPDVDPNDLVGRFRSLVVRRM